jgi:hypothetical protein
MWKSAIMASAIQFMSRISIDITEDEHKKLKAMAALRGKSIKDYVLERTMGADEDAALVELEKLLDRRIQAARAGAVSRKTASQVFAAATRKGVK